MAVWRLSGIASATEKTGESGIDDHALVARAVAREDPDAFGELVRRHQSHVRNFLRKLTRDFDLADDLAQDVFLQAWNKLQSYRGEGTFKSWLLTIAYTTFLQSKRRSSRYGEILEELGQDTEAGGGRHTEQSSEITDLDKFLAVLSEEDRAIMILSYACGLSHREIGNATRLPVGTVKSIIFRGKEKIRDSFDIKDHQYG